MLEAKKTLDIKKTGGNVVVAFLDKKWTFQGPWEEVFGAFPQYVKGNEIPVVLGRKKVENLRLSTDNPRIAPDSKNIKPQDKDGQIRIKKYLMGDFKTPATTDSENNSNANLLKTGMDKLEASFEFHGGQNEPLWTRKNITVEGNRRLSLMSDRQDELALVLGYPDETTDEEIFAIINQKHNQGSMEWSSYARAKEAYRAYYEYRWSMQELIASMGFSSAKDAEKYIHSYIWFEKSKLTDIRHWSKFHHAYVPTLVTHFGYNKETCQFETNGRKAYKNGASPEEIDVIAGTKTDFEWFVNLIKNKKVTDCRQSDGVVAPAIRDANEEYGKQVLRLLQQEPKKDEPAPADMAWKFLKEQKQQSVNSMTTKVDNINHEFRKFTRSKKNLEKFKEDPAQQRLLVSAFKDLATIADVISKWLED